MPKVAPVLETKRLILRGHRVSDFEALAMMWADTEVTRYTSGQGSIREESWARLLRYIGLWPALGFGYFAVTDKMSGNYLGDVGLADFKRDITPSLDGFAEAGWVLVREAWGKGLASEALDAVLNWYAAQPAPCRVACIMDPQNHASRQVAEKCGFVEIAHTDYKGSIGIMFQRKTWQN